MDQLFKISKQTAWQILGKLVTSVSTFIILGVVTRNYGQEGTGVFTLSLAYLAMFYLLADFGFNAHVLRKLKVQPLDFARSERFGKSEKLKVEWRQLLGTRLVWAAVSVILAVGLLSFLPFGSAELSKAIIFGSLAIFGSAIFVTCNLIFQARLRYELSVLASSLGTLASLPIFLILSVYKYPAYFLLLAHFFGWVIIAVLGLALIRKLLKGIKPIFSFDYTYLLFKQSWPIAATLILNIVYFRADSFMIAYFKPIADVGIYNVAYAVFQSVLVLPTFIMNAYYPLMLTSLNGVKFVGLSLFALAGFGTLMMTFFAPLILRILTGGGFIGSVQSLQILSLGFPAYFLSALSMWLLVTKGRYKIMLLIYTSGLAFNLILNFIYIPTYSFLAASWITVISEYAIFIMQVFVLRGIIFR